MWLRLGKKCQQTPTRTSNHGMRRVSLNWKQLIRIASGIPSTSLFPMDLLTNCECWCVHYSADSAMWICAHTSSQFRSKSHKSGLYGEYYVFSNLDGSPTEAYVSIRHLDNIVLVRTSGYGTMHVPEAIEEGKSGYFWCKWKQPFKNEGDDEASMNILHCMS